MVNKSCSKISHPAMTVNPATIPRHTLKRGFFSANLRSRFGRGNFVAAKVCFATLSQKAD